MARFAPHKRGTLNHNAKLDRAKVLYIRASTRSNQALARELGVSKAAISNVRTGRTWSWLTSDADAADSRAGQPPAEAAVRPADVSSDAPAEARVAAAEEPPSPDAGPSPYAAAPAPRVLADSVRSRSSPVVAPASAPGAPRDVTGSAPGSAPAVDRCAGPSTAGPTAPRAAHTHAPAASVAADTSAVSVARPRELTTTHAAILRAHVAGRVSARDTGTGTRTADILTRAPTAASAVDAAAAESHVP